MSVCDNKKLNVLITGIGAIIGYGIIKSIRNSDIKAHIIGMDIYLDAVGQYWCDDFVQAVNASEMEYIPFLKQVINDYKVDIVFFGTEQEIYRCVKARKELGDVYKKLVINREELLGISVDKWRTHEVLIRNGLEKFVIPSAIEGEYKELSKLWGDEILLKPRSSYASKGIHRVCNKKDFEFYKKKMGKNFMAQCIVGDVEHEYTVGVFGLGDGSYSEMIQLKRKLSKEGATAKAESVDIKELRNAVSELCRVFKPLGPTNFQFRAYLDRFYLLEVNPRISSSTSIRMALGYNEAEMSICYFLYGNVLHPKIKKGHAIRYIDEVIVAK